MAFYNYCPQCGSLLIYRNIDKKEYLTCSISSCNFIFWNNPILVVAAIVETEEGIVLARNKKWPDGIYSMITGFVEAYESPEVAVIRECEEELGLSGSNPSLVGIYPYNRSNQVIIVYHVKAIGFLKINEELDSIRIFSKEELAAWPFGQEELEGWPFGCGWAIRDWLKSM